MTKPMGRQFLVPKGKWAKGRDYITPVSDILGSFCHESHSESFTIPLWPQHQGERGKEAQSSVPCI